jgi:hypothetical protein
VKENSIEEDIEILEEMIENANIENMDMNNCFGGEHIEAIEHILSDYKRVLEINEVLLKENEELKADNYELNNRINDLLDNIPVQKVKDKIEEILNNGEYRIIFEGDAEFPDEATCIDAQKYIKLEKLQELLEGRK